MTLSGALLDGQPVDITIRDTHIEAVTPHRESPSASDIWDAGGLAVFPGLVNMHSHAPMTLLRGVGNDQPLDRWLHDYVWPAEQRLTDELVYQGTLAACHEMLASGTTEFNDMYFRMPAMLRAVRESGIRARLGFTVFGDGAELDNLDVDTTAPFAIAPHAIYTVSETGLRRCAEVCIRLGVPMHIHMSETQREVDDCLREHGCRPWHWLDRLGTLDMMGSNLIAAHCLHLSDDEIRLIGAHHVTCVHCPNSNLKLGSGYRFPMLELLDAGACVRLGTDGSASSDNLDMIEVMKTAALLQKGWRGDASAVTARQIFDMASGGALIEAGAPANLFLIRLNNAPESPIAAHDTAYATLVYATHGESVALTMVDGVVRYNKLNNRI